MKRPLTADEHALVARWMPLACALARRTVMRGRLYADWDDVPQIAALALCELLPQLIDAGYVIRGQLMTRTVCRWLSNLSLASRYTRMRRRTLGAVAGRTERTPETLMSGTLIDGANYSPTTYDTSDAAITATWLRRAYSARRTGGNGDRPATKRQNFSVLLGSVAAGVEDRCDADYARQVWHAASASAASLRLLRIKRGIQEVVR